MKLTIPEKPSLTSLRLSLSRLQRKAAREQFLTSVDDLGTHKGIFANIAKASCYVFMHCLTHLNGQDSFLFKINMNCIL